MTGAGRRSAAVVGGAVSGLAAAQGLSAVDDVDDVVVYERQSYDDRRVHCGEAINDATLIPIEPTARNGFLNDVTGFHLQIFGSTDRPATADPIATADVRCDPGYVCDRALVEKRWAEHLERRGVEFRTGVTVTPAEYRTIVDAHDYVVDATGQPSLTLRARGLTERYTGDMVALNATVEGDFSAFDDRPRIFFEGYVGYAWAFPKSETRANVGIGWAGDDRPDDYLDALAAAAERNGFPVPDREDVNVYTIPRGPSLDPELTCFLDDGVFLVGDAAGIANRYQGEGICQGIRSAYLLCELVGRSKERTYPGRLYELMKSEYRLAHLMRGVWVEHEDPDLLAAVVEAIDGLTVEAITRSPARVVGRLARRPAVAARLLSSRGMRRRVYRAYTDAWEYERRAVEG